MKSLKRYGRNGNLEVKGNRVMFAVHKFSIKHVHLKIAGTRGWHEVISIMKKEK
jgi:hypothetical protein